MTADSVADRADGSGVPRLSPVRLTRLESKGQLIPGAPIAREMKLLISTLPGSGTYKLSVEVYLRHREAEKGSCGACGRVAPCPAQRHAAAVIEAAGEDPHWYDERPDPPGNASELRPMERHPASRPAQNAGLPPGVTGYHVGGLGRRADVPYQEYER